MKSCRATSRRISCPSAWTTLMASSVSATPRNPGCSSGAGTSHMGVKTSWGAHHPSWQSWRSDVSLKAFSPLESLVEVDFRGCVWWSWISLSLSALYTMWFCWQVPVVLPHPWSKVKYMWEEIILILNYFSQCGFLLWLVRFCFFYNGFSKR